MFEFCIGKRLAMITRTYSYETVRSFLFGQLTDEIYASSNFESPNWQMILMLKIEFESKQLIQQWPRSQKRWPKDPMHSRQGLDHVLVLDREVHHVINIAWILGQCAVSCFFQFFNAILPHMSDRRTLTKGLQHFFSFLERGRGRGDRKWFSLHVPAIDNRVEIYYQELDLDKVTHIDTCTLPSSPPPSCWFQLWSLLFKNSLRRAERADKKSDSSPSPSKFPSSSDRGWYG